MKRVMHGKGTMAAIGLLVLGAILAGCGPAERSAHNPAREVPLTAVPELLVEKIEPPTALPGQPFQAEIRILNRGTEVLTGVEARLELAPGLQLLDADPRPHTADMPTWQLGDLAPGEEIYIKLTLRGEAGEFRNTVEVRASKPVSVQATGLVALAPIPGITASLMDSPGVAPVGERVTYTLVLQGQGYGEARDVAVEVEIPEGMGLEAVEAPFSHSVDGNTISFEPFPLGEGEEVSIRFVLVAEEAGDMVVRTLVGYKGFAHRIVIEEGTVIYGGD